MARHLLSGQKSNYWRAAYADPKQRRRGPWVDFPCGTDSGWDYSMQLEHLMLEDAFILTLVREGKNLYPLSQRDSYAQVTLSRKLSTAYDELRNQAKIEGHPRGALRRTSTMSNMIKLVVALESTAANFSQTTDEHPWHDTAYHVSIKERAGEPLIEVVCIDHQDADVEGYYHSEKELPMWMQEKLAVLRLLDMSDRNAKQCPGVGARIDADTFWVYRE